MKNSPHNFEISRVDCTCISIYIYGPAEAGPFLVCSWAVSYSVPALKKKYRQFDVQIIISPLLEGAIVTTMADVFLSNDNTI